MPSALDSLRPFFSKLSNIAFILVIASYVLVNFAKIDVSLLRTLQIVAWATFAMVCMLEALMPNKAKYATLYKILSLGTAVAALGILFFTMKWEGYRNLLLVGAATAFPVALLLLLLAKSIDNFLLKGFVVGGLAAFLLRNILLGT